MGMGASSKVLNAAKVAEMGGTSKGGDVLDGHMINKRTSAC
jgi:hypothetical protein